MNSFSKAVLVFCFVLIAFGAGVAVTLCYFVTEQTSVVIQNSGDGKEAVTPYGNDGLGDLITDEFTAPTSVEGQALAISTSNMYSSNVELGEYRWMLEKELGSAWTEMFTEARKDRPSITDLDVARWVGSISNLSVPTELMSWPSVSGTPWTINQFTVTFAEKGSSGFFVVPDSMSVKLIDGDIAGITPKDLALWDTITCPANTAEDISVLADAFALAYPAAKEDANLCEHISVRKVQSETWGEINIYTLDTGFSPFDYERSGGETLIYRPSIIIKDAKKDDLLEAFQSTHYSLIEISLKGEGLEQYADSIINLYPELRFEGFCGYDSCY